MTAREWLELAGMLAVACVAFVGGVLAMLLYVLAIGAAVGGMIGAAVWAFRALTGW